GGELLGSVASGAVCRSGRQVPARASTVLWRQTTAAGVDDADKVLWSTQAPVAADVRATHALRPYRNVVVVPTRARQAEAPCRGRGWSGPAQRENKDDQTGGLRSGRFRAQPATRPRWVTVAATQHSGEGKAEEEKYAAAEEEERDARRPPAPAEGGTSTVNCDATLNGSAAGTEGRANVRCSAATPAGQSGSATLGHPGVEDEENHRVPFSPAEPQGGLVPPDVPAEGADDTITVSVGASAAVPRAASRSAERPGRTSRVIPPTMGTEAEAEASTADVDGVRRAAEGVAGAGSSKVQGPVPRKFGLSGGRPAAVAAAVQVCGGMPDYHTQQAWREKVTLVMLIVFLCSVFAFVTFGSNIVLCTSLGGKFMAADVASYKPTTFPHRFVIHGRLY
ncbi:MAG: hypothetical protein BJ554DRAFT_1580, partial [Olpidium bornovanus]